MTNRSKRRRVCHISSVHRPEDNRVHYKECASLAEAGWDVTLIVPHAERARSAPGVSLVSVPAPQSRTKRILYTTRQVIRAAMALHPDIIHFHDPELLPWLALLRPKGVKLIYDVHEDAAATVEYKGYIPRGFRRPLARALRWIEWRGIERMDGVVAATPFIGSLMTRGATPVSVVQNFPRLEEIPAIASVERNSARRVIYVGRITEPRGAFNMLSMLERLPSDVRLDLVGDYAPAVLESRLREHPAWARVDAHGYQDRPKVAELTARASVGLILLHPERNYLDSYPTKLFEYMAASLPVVASDFPLWRSIVDDAGCGLLVDPMDPIACAAAVARLLDDHAVACEMGRSGRSAVEGKFNWGEEAVKLARFYDEVLSG